MSVIACNEMWAIVEWGDGDFDTVDVYQATGRGLVDSGTVLYDMVGILPGIEAETCQAG